MSGSRLNGVPAIKRFTSERYHGLFRAQINLVEIKMPGGCWGEDSDHTRLSQVSVTGTSAHLTSTRQGRNVSLSNDITD